MLKKINQSINIQLQAYLIKLYIYQNILVILQHKLVY